MFNDTAYKLLIYGDERIQDETRHFETLEAATASVEGRRSDDADGWEMQDGSIRLIDYNNGCAVINKIQIVDKDSVDGEILKESVFSPDA